MRHTVQHTLAMMHVHCRLYDTARDCRMLGPFAKWKVHTLPSNQMTACLSLHRTAVCVYQDGSTAVLSSIAKAVTVGDGFQCTLGSDHSLECYGSPPGDQTQFPGKTFVAVDAGYNSLCAIQTDGTLLCIDGAGGQLADVPGSVDQQWSQVACGGYFCCGLKEDATLSCWGDNSYGQLDIPYPDSQVGGQARRAALLRGHLP